MRIGKGDDIMAADNFRRKFAKIFMFVMVD
jgi:hypothetical protein